MYDIKFNIIAYFENKLLTVMVNFSGGLVLKSIKNSNLIVLDLIADHTSLKRLQVVPLGKWSGFYVLFTPGDMHDKCSCL